MATQLTIDPVTRIEGHLRVDVSVDAGRVRDAWASATMWRGVETILKGRDPREAWTFTQRFCGVCTTVHAMASVRSVENALQLAIPDNAQFIRNLILIAHGLHDHLVHFYHLSALDWVDVTTVPKARAAKALAVAETLSDWSGNSLNAMRDTQKRIESFVAGGQLGIFSHGYWGHPAMKLSPEINLLATTHYLQALEVQRRANQAVAILGGKTPHIQNLAVGGVMNAINLDSQGALNMDKLYMVKGLLDSVKQFVQEVYLPDVCALAALYPEWLEYGRGVDNYLAVPDLPLNGVASDFDLPGGVIFDGKLDGVEAISSFNDDRFREGVLEDVAHAWYDGAADHPFRGTTEPHMTEFDTKGKYTWVKAPRFEDQPMQVGPLSQVLVGYALGDERTRRWTDHALGLVKAVGKRSVGVGALHSTMGRHLARAIRAAMLAELATEHWERLATNVLNGDATTFNEPRFPEGEIMGVGMHEAPRGTLSHWSVINNGRLANYQAVVPTTWNASPRDEKGRPGPYEASLVGNPVAQPDAPLEVLRTVHSFDPCMACAVHAYDPDGQELVRVKTLS